MLGLQPGSFDSSSGSDPLMSAFDAMALENDVKKKEVNGKLYKLLLVLNSYDIQLMKTVVKSMEG